MAISKEKLAAIINGTAKQLCSPEGDMLIEQSKNSLSGDYYNPSPTEFDYDAQQYDSLFYGEMNETKNMGDIKYNEASASNSKLPEHIKQSMLTEKIDASALSNVSVLDQLGIKPTKPSKPKKTITENSTPHYQPNNSGIDYSIIKAIVNECLKEHSKQQLNESNSLKTIALSGGTISLVDNKGNIYKAKLEKINNKG